MRVSVPAANGEFWIDDDRLSGFRAELDTLGTAEPVRRVYAALHLVMLPSYRQVGHSPETPGEPAAIAEHVDWTATVALRRRFDRLGFGIAEAMDTAQRFELGWAGAERLIRACGQLGLAHGFIAGAGTDHLRDVNDRDQWVDGVAWQAELIRGCGGMPIVLPSVWLAEHARTEDDYVDVYRAVIERCDGPLFVHWLGEMFLPALKGYFPGDSFRRVMAIDPDKVRGCKLSLLDDVQELAVRRELLPRGQIVLTGDDHHFSRLILGDARVESHGDLDGRALALGDFSHALLGVFDAIAAPASLALQFLAHGQIDRYLEIMAPCEELGRALFGEPTAHYKAGLAWVSYLNGWQDELTLVNHVERCRSLDHYLRVAELAAAAGALVAAETAADRIARLRDKA